MTSYLALGFTMLVILLTCNLAPVCALALDKFMRAFPY